MNGYRHVNVQRNSVAELVATAPYQEAAATLWGVKIVLYFAQTRLADARACVETDA